MITVGPTGKTVTGRVLDVNKTFLERKLKDYDAQLYLKWNPEKCWGEGCWEIRRRPNLKSATLAAEYKGTKIFKVDYQELDIINHVLDLPVLNYYALVRIAQMDAWKVKDYVRDLEYREDQDYNQRLDKNRAEMLYNAKQHKSAIRDFKEALLSGTNPAELAKYWGKLGQ